MAISKAEFVSALYSLGVLRVASLGEAFEYTSGKRGPVYVDCRLIPGNTRVFHEVLDRLYSQMRDYQVVALAGVEGGGVPFAVGLATSIRKDYFSVRKNEKSHGLKMRITGGSVDRRNLIVFEDTVNFGESLMNAVTALREGGAKVIMCLSVFAHHPNVLVEMQEKLGIPITSLVTLGDFKDSFLSAVCATEQNSAQWREVEKWQENPVKWSDEYLARK